MSKPEAIIPEAIIPEAIIPEAIIPEAIIPKAIIIGPMKCGTTWAHDYLLERKDVCLPRGVKETFYFDRNYDLGQDWYRKCFSHYDSERHRLSVEVAPSYFPSNEAAERIRAELGRVRLIVIVRDPVRRAWSHYCHMRRYGYTEKPLREAACEFPAILEASRYTARLAAWTDRFGSGAITLCSFEKLKQDEDGFCRDLCSALRIEYIPPLAGGRRERNSAAVSKSARAAKMSRAIAHKMRRRRLHFLVNAAKAAGLKRLVYGHAADSPPPEPSLEDIKWLEEQLRPDFVTLGRQIDPREHRWLEKYL